MDLEQRGLAQAVQTSAGMSGPEFDARFERLEVLIRAESAAVIAQTRALMDERTDETRALIDERTDETRALIDERTVTLRTLIDERSAELRRQIDQNRALIGQEAAETREYVDLRASETRTHFDAVAEQLREEIKGIADGYGALRGDVNELKAGQARLERGLTRLDLRMLVLERDRAG